MIVVHTGNRVTNLTTVLRTTNEYVVCNIEILKESEWRNAFTNVLTIPTLHDACILRVMDT